MAAAEGGGEEGEGGQLILTQGQVMEAMVGATNSQQEGVMGFVAKYEVSTPPWATVYRHVSLIFFEVWLLDNWTRQMSPEPGAVVAVYEFML
jgi:hypothetical protein